MSQNSQRRQDDSPPEKERPAGSAPTGNAPAGDAAGPDVVGVRRARQGVKLGRMRYVLLFGILLTVIAFLIGYLIL